MTDHSSTLISPASQSEVPPAETGEEEEAWPKTTDETRPGHIVGSRRDQSHDTKPKPWED